jgi:acyl-CoA synthetase (AMP-forming)/AMP-acid ligase II
MSGILDALSARARDMPDALAFAIEGERLSFAQLRDEARWLAGRLARAGVTPGSRVALLLPTGLDFVRAVYAAQMLGGVPAAIDPALPAAGHLRRLAALEPAVTLTTASLAAAATHPAAGTVTTLDALARAPGRPDVRLDGRGEPIAYLQFTSGSTGEPRAAIVGHEGLAAHLGAIQERFELSPSDVAASWVPLHGSTGLVRYVFGTVWFGCSCHLVRPSAVRLGRWLSLLTEARATVTGAPDFAYRLAARSAPAAGIDLGRLRLATNGGEAVRATTVERFEHRFGLRHVVQPAYGLSEATLIVASGAPGDPLAIDETGAVCCGRPLGNVDVRIVDAAGCPSPPLVEGEVQVRGPAVFRGYFRDPEGTSRALSGEWLCTGDIGVLDASGRLYVRSRVRALIKRAGAGIAPREIEEQVELIDGVLGAAALGVPREDAATEDVLVVVESRTVARDAASRLAAQVEHGVTAVIGGAPWRVIVTEEGAIPRTAAGKVRYAELRRLAGDRAFLDAALFSG